MIRVKALLQEYLNSFDLSVTEQQYVHRVPLALLGVGLAGEGRDQGVDLGELGELLGDQGEDHEDDAHGEELPVGRVGVDVSVADGCDSDDQEIEHIVELVGLVWDHTILLRRFFFGRVLLFYDIDFLDVNVFNSEHDGSENDNGSHENVEESEPNS